MRKWFAGFLLVAGLACVAPAHAIDDNFDKTAPLAPGGALHLENINGSVDVTAWDRNVVEIQAVKSTRRDPADLQRVTIEVVEKTGRVDVLTHYPQDGSVDVTVEYHVHVPRHVRLDHVATVNGNVRVTGVDGQGELRTVNGNVELYDCAGGFNARSTNGGIREELYRLDPAEFSLQTINGSILLAVPPNTAAELDARSMNGDIRSDVPVSVNGAFSPGKFHGKLGAGGKFVHIRTVNGAIQIA
ncbi:MAG: DUF4097 family beta strand repeat-containing protein, partial [Bryobacteraceae bacterium]